MTKTKVKVWDPLVRIFHWSVVAIVIVNTALLEEGKVHEALGYILVALLGVRFLWGWIGSPTARFRSFFPTRQRLSAHFKGAQSTSLGHNPIGALMIFNLMVTLAFIGLSGYLMTTTLFWGSEVMEEIHEVLVGYLIFSVALHVLGVLVESYRSRTNLISAMITGRKSLSEPPNMGTQ